MRVTKNEIMDFVRPYYADKDIMHDFWHIRLLQNAIENVLSLGRYAVDRECLTLAAYFHGFVYRDPDAIRAWMDAHGYDAEYTNKVITVSMESQRPNAPETLEGKILHDAHVLEGGRTYLTVKTLITGSVRGQSLEQTLEFMRDHVLGKNRCYLPETIPLCEEMNRYTYDFYMELSRGVNMENPKVILRPMTRQMCHSFYKGFENDPAIGHYYEYIYDAENVERYFDNNTVSDRRLFAILAGDQIVGECKLKSIDFEKLECSMGIHLQNDAVKGKGYGTQAERLILQYAFEELGMHAVNADAALKNTRSQHVLEKVGFRYTHEDDTFKYYRCENSKHLREKLIQKLMGKFVHVLVDRPVGYQHGDITYPINYGYIPGLIACDGEEQDAYILGINEPITEFDGQVIAAIRRMNDCEDKLVVAPVGSVYHQGQIAEAVRFQERYFDIRVISCFEKSCGVLPFRMVNGRQEFLLVFETYSRCWSLPKGHIEAGETDIQAALRELFEETGLTAKLDTTRIASMEYPISSFARKQVVFFLGEVAGVPKVREGEIDKYKWVTAEELKDYLFPDTYEACKTLLR